MLLMTKYLLIIFLLILFSGYSRSQSADQPGGRDLPACGRIHALFIFAQFPDDDYLPDDARWPKGDEPKRMREYTWVDSVWNQNATPWSMTDYFNQMSFNKLKFTGETDTVTVPHTRKWYYLNKKSFGNINKDILKTLDSRIDFSGFDTIKKLRNYEFAFRADGKVDMVFIIYRNFIMDYPDSIAEKYNKVFGSGWFGSLNTGNVYVDDSSRIVYTGATLRDIFHKDPFRFSIHEFAHFLIGGNQYHNGRGFWAMLSGYEVRSFMINAYERNRLGWINIRTIPNDTLTLKNIPLGDFLTTGDAIRIEIDSSSSQYFYLENHQRISRWDNSSKVKGEKGIYVIRQDAAAGEAAFMQMIPADGRFNWEVKNFVYPEWYPKGLPVFERKNENKETGYHDLQFVPFIFEGKRYPPNEIIYYADTLTGKPVQDPLRSGDGRDAFRPGYKTVLSPYSNPDSQDKNRNQTGFAFDITDFRDCVYYLNIYLHTYNKDKRLK
jgi:M6 family metalloprotease-like protein